MTPIQPALDGTIPPPVSDFETWAATVRPTLVQVARSHRRHWLIWEIKREFKLPEPPDPAHDWGRLTTHLKDDGVIQHDGVGQTRDKSLVHAWCGTRAARRGRVT
ncbi:hypothetical protein ACWGHA_11030 [Streptomyces xanthophaeus]